MDSASVPASRFLTWVSAMTSLNGLNGLWPGLCKFNKPFLSKLLLVTMFYHSSKNPMQHAYTHFRLLTPDPLPQITSLFFQINTPYILGSSQAFLLKSIQEAEKYQNSKFKSEEKNLNSVLQSSLTSWALSCFDVVTVQDKACGRMSRTCPCHYSLSFPLLSHQSFYNPLEPVGDSHIIWIFPLYYLRGCSVL